MSRILISSTLMTIKNSAFHVRFFVSFFSQSAIITFNVSYTQYEFICNTTIESGLYKVYCEPRHGMGMLKVPEEATKECLSGFYNLQNNVQVNISFKFFSFLLNFFISFKHKTRHV